MTKDEARKHFDIKTCTNPEHEFVFLGRLFMWQIANDIWAHLVQVTPGVWEQRKQFLAIEKISRSDKDGEATTIVIWKFRIIFAKY